MPGRFVLQNIIPNRTIAYAAIDKQSCRRIVHTGQPHRIINDIQVSRHFFTTDFYTIERTVSSRIYIANDVYFIIMNASRSFLTGFYILGIYTGGVFGSSKIYDIIRNDTLFKSPSHIECSVRRSSPVVIKFITGNRISFHSLQINRFSTLITESIVPDTSSCLIRRSIDPTGP